MIKLTEEDLDLIGKVYYGYDHPASEEEGEIWARETLSMSLLDMRKKHFNLLKSFALALLNKTPKT